MKKPVPLTCSTEYSSSVQSIEWIVNGRQIWEDSNLLTESGQIISNLLFVPEIEDVVVQCNVKGIKVKSAFVFFSVHKEPKTVKLQKAEMSKTKKILWIPFDIKSLEINRLESSGEETAATYSRDIYQFMQDEPADAADSFRGKRNHKHHQKKTDKFVEELHPISLPFVRESAYSSASTLSVACFNVWLCSLYS